MVGVVNAPNRHAVWAYARVGSLPLEAYSPRQGRLAAVSSEVAPVRLDKWERGQRHNQGVRDEAQTKRISKARWSRLPKIPLETKHISLLWLMAHAAVPTAAQLSHYIPDLEPACKFCSTVIQTSDANDDPGSLESENIAHYFWACPRIRDFWQRVSRFLQDIRTETAGPVFQVDLRMVATGFGAWSKRLPNVDALHGLAVWEIYRARAELSLEGTAHSGEAMFIRWKLSLMQRINQDFIYAFTQLKAAHSFHNRWLMVSNRWYHFDPGENELSGKLSFHSSPHTLDSSHTIDSNNILSSQSADTSSASSTPTSNVLSSQTPDTPRDDRLST
ncbi:hypothetical protein IWW37_006019 [Coemansia sp. RSA 2050]|nr:hypothetical protein IWW37_006019 [Coemansia sp. RSA 2050]